MFICCRCLHFGRHDILFNCHPERSETESWGSNPCLVVCRFLDAVQLRWDFSTPLHFGRNDGCVARNDIIWILIDMRSLHVGRDDIIRMRCLHCGRHDIFMRSLRLRYASLGMTMRIRFLHCGRNDIWMRFLHSATLRSKWHYGEGWHFIGRDDVIRMLNYLALRKRCRRCRHT